MPKPEKINAVAEMKKLFEEADSFFVTDYQGLNVADVTALRTNLRENNVSYLVAKNTLLRLALPRPESRGSTKYFDRSDRRGVCRRRTRSVAAKVIQDSIKERELPRIKVFVVDKHQHMPDDLRPAGRTAVARIAPVAARGGCRGAADRRWSVRSTGSSGSWSVWSTRWRTNGKPKDNGSDATLRRR